MRSGVSDESDARQIRKLLVRLSAEHATQDMRDERVQIPGTDIELWATHAIQLSGIARRVTWRYEERDGHRVVVCFTLVSL